MSIKSILCIFSGTQDELNALDTALVLGEAYGAHIRILHISSEAVTDIGGYGEGILASGAIIEAIRKENAERLKKAKQYVVSYAAKHHLSLDETQTPSHHASVRFQHVVGGINATIAREGRLSDLIILGREVAPTHDLITPALFDTGRPVLVLPPAHEELAGKFTDKTVAFAWNGSLQAARALFNALPLLQRTEKLYIVTVEKHGHDLALEAGVMAYLQAHGIPSQGIMIAASSQRSTAEAIAMRAKELHADLLVMGAYGHSMLREMVLGGVTERMLQNAGIPLLLSH